MAKKTHGRFRSSRKPVVPKKPARENNRHHFQQSAVLERCICGELKDDPIHIRRRKAQAPLPPEPELVQVGISPDTDTTRMWARNVLHWRFMERVDDGVWLVDTLRPWPANVNFEATLTLADGTEISINLEWP